MQYYLGLDIGSTSTELVVMDENSEIVFLENGPTCAMIDKTGNELINKAKNQLGCETGDFGKLVITGYGRKHFNLHDMKIKKGDVTEITCYGKGAFWLNPKIRTIIDIGGQDSKVIALEENGAVKNFAMNDKCAAGTGKFLEMTAQQFNMNLNDFGQISKNATKTVKISNICAVFAQSEIVSLVSKGTELADIIKSVEKSIISKISNMVDRLGLKDDLMFCGGVAKNQGITSSLEEKFDCPIFRPDNVEYVGAIGAALFASQSA